MDPIEQITYDRGSIRFAEDGDERTYTVMLVPEQVETSDGRIMLEDSLGWRDGRLPVSFSDNEGSHQDAVFVGNLDNIRFETIDGTRWAVADLDWDTGEDATVAVRARRLVDEDRMRGVSVHLSDMDAEFICEEEDDEGWCIDGVLEVSSATIASVTILMIPAFEDAEIVVNEPVAASISLRQPPRDWFNNPQLDSPSVVTVTDDGHVFGHLALWESCYRGMDVCLTPPRGDTSYSEFHANASITCDDGATIQVGCITMGTGHAATTAGLTAEQRTRHYDHEGLTIAYVRAGQDQFGVWVSGALRTGVTDDQVDTLRRHRLSGDWHPIKGQHRLIAALVVNVPGYPVAASIRAGVQTSYVTAGPLPHAEPDSGVALVAAALKHISDQIKDLTTEMSPLTAQARRTELDDLLGSMTGG